jgi:hypothetical protein
MLNLKNKLIGPTGPILLSAVNGILLIIFWIFINQVRVEPQAAQTQIKAAGLYNDGTYRASSQTPWGD